MNHFTIFAHGEDFDPDAYLIHAPFRFDHVWHRGDLRGCPEFIQDEHPTSGIEKFLGDGRELTIFEQDQIATEFLESHESDLLELSRFPGVDTFILGLHFRVPLLPSLCGFSMSHSPRLMYFALKTSVDLHFYVDLDQTDETN